MAARPHPKEAEAGPGRKECQKVQVLSSSHHPVSNHGLRLQNRCAWQGPVRVLNRDFTAGWYPNAVGSQALCLPTVCAHPVCPGRASRGGPRLSLLLTPRRQQDHVVLRGQSWSLIWECELLRAALPGTFIPSSPRLNFQK